MLDVECTHEYGLVEYSHRHPDDRDRVLASAGDLLEIGRSTQEYRFARKDGRYVWLRDELRVVNDEAGRPAELVGTFTEMGEGQTGEADILPAPPAASPGVGALPEAAHARGASPQLDALVAGLERCGLLVRELSAYAKSAQVRTPPRLSHGRHAVRCRALVGITPPS